MDIRRIVLLICMVALAEFSQAQGGKIAAKVLKLEGSADTYPWLQPTELKMHIPKHHALIQGEMLAHGQMVHCTSGFVKLQYLADLQTVTLTKSSPPLMVVCHWPHEENQARQELDLAARKAARARGLDGLILYPCRGQSVLCSLFEVVPSQNGEGVMKIVLKCGNDSKDFTGLPWRTFSSTELRAVCEKCRDSSQPAELFVCKDGVPIEDMKLEFLSKSEEYQLLLELAEANCSSAPNIRHIRRATAFANYRMFGFARYELEQAAALKPADSFLKKRIAYLRDLGVASLPSPDRSSPGSQ